MEEDCSIHPNLHDELVGGSDGRNYQYVKVAVDRNRVVPLQGVEGMFWDVLGVHVGHD